MMRNYPVLLCAFVAGCSTVAGGETQSLLVATREANGTSVAGAECTLQNSRGQWKVTTPGSVQVRREADDMIVDCRKGSDAPGIAKLVSRAHGGMIANVLFWPGAIVDHSKGTGYEYPNNVVVTMGLTSIIDRKDEQAAEQAKA